MKNTIDNNVQIVKNLVKEKLSKDVLSCEAVGKGAVGKVYKVTLNPSNDVLAVKIAENESLILEEYNNIKFLSERIDIKLPKIFFVHTADVVFPINVICMQYFDGVSSQNNKFKFKSRKTKQKFANSAVDNLIKLHSIKNDKFGPVDNAVYDNWHDYYKPFSEKVLLAAENAFNQDNFSEFVYGVMKTAVANYDKIFDEPISTPTLIHGDYWMPNLMVNNKMDLIGVVDPFNVMWADRDYELFALNVALGKHFKLYENYKAKENISDKCDLKIEFYALFSEVYWFTRTGHKFDEFLKFKAKLLQKQMKRFNII